MWLYFDSSTLNVGINFIITMMRYLHISQAFNESLCSWKENMLLLLCLLQLLALFLFFILQNGIRSGTITFHSVSPFKIPLAALSTVLNGLGQDREKSLNTLVHPLKTVIPCDSCKCVGCS